MGQKVKQRHERKPKSPRNYAAKDMILSSGRAGPMRHRSDRRPKDKRKEKEYSDE